MTIFGWDMSHFDAPTIGGAVGDGISFITHKAGGDSNSGDPEIAPWWSGVRDLGDNVLLGAYWVLYPGSPAARADAFIARLDEVCDGWRDRPFILQLDCEKWNGDSSTVPGRADIKACCDRLRARMPRLRPIVYAPRWVYGDALSGLGYPLWASSYVTGSGGFKQLYPGDGSSRWAVYSGQTPAILQYTSSATIGGQTTCDANAYRGTLANLRALVAPGWEDDVALTADDIKAIWSYGLVNGYTGATQPAGDFLRYTPSAQRTMDLQAQVSQLAGKLDAFISAEGVDDSTKAQALQAIHDAVGAVAPQVLANLPQGTDPVSQDEVSAAVKQAFHDAFSAA